MSVSPDSSYSVEITTPLLTPDLPTLLQKKVTDLTCPLLLYQKLIIAYNCKDEFVVPLINKTWVEEWSGTTLFSS